MHFFFQAVWGLGKEVLPLAEGIKKNERITINASTGEIPVQEEIDCEQRGDHGPGPERCGHPQVQDFGGISQVDACYLHPQLEHQVFPCEFILTNILLMIN